MKKKIYKLIIIGIGAILLILIITNPSKEKYTEYLTTKGVYLGSAGSRSYWGRESNYFIFSIFSFHNGETLDSPFFYTRKDIGVFGNFYSLK